ncbi:type I restriction enzyme HsdR N-terminal domain-containing protein [uncultured Dietzia sp.]|uniref:type I restriction enzyme HsdR N-terminal domain-containing protein n=1 Tax=uncultured Dietzia sp. TaxID=395519 RepID=UPI0025E38440|nr:type I restriction enzyme HsdR N-terminal domain-containing protein [uncultured Dietzia sp.]
MSIDQAIAALASRVRELKPIIETEEATKTAFIIPFIEDVLGYDVTDPREVIPEYTADVGVKKGEKVDFAIKSGSDFRFLIEAKKIGEPISLNHANQLVRYFNVTDTEFAILTNGEVYQFYAQLDAANRMDEKPFMTLDLSDIDARIFPHLEMCTRTRFDSETIAASAEQLKYVAELRRALAAELKDPSAEFVKLLASKVTTRRMTSAVLESFTKMVATAASQLLKDEANRRLRSAQDLEEAVVPSVPLDDADSAASDQVVSDIVTTEAELHGWNIIRAISAAEVQFGDVTLRDAKSYCAILYKDNNRKPIARLYFDRQVPRIGIFDDEKNELMHELESVESIYEHAEEIRARARFLRDS